MKTVITYGTFDLFHIGHLRLLQRAKALGDKLIVAVSTDEFNLQKGKRAIIPFEHRAEIIKNLKCVDMVISEQTWEQKVEDIIKYKVDIFVMGDDWKGKFDFLSQYCEVVYLPRTEGISSTELKEVLQRFSNGESDTLVSVLKMLSKVDLEAVIKALSVLQELKKNLL